MNNINFLSVKNVYCICTRTDGVSSSLNIFRDRLNLLDTYNDQEMHRHYRFNTRTGVRFLVDLLSTWYLLLGCCFSKRLRLSEELQNKTSRSCAITPVMKFFFIAFNYHATGSVLANAATTDGCSIATTSRIV